MAALCTFVAYKNFVSDANVLDWTIGVSYIGFAFFFLSCWLTAVIGTSLVFSNLVHYLGMFMVIVSAINILFFSGT